MFDNIYKDKKVLITGNTGFKGSWLSLWLNSLGAKVYGISNSLPSKPSMFEHLNISSMIHHNWHDIRDLENLISLISKIKPDFIFHLAAQALVFKSYRNPIDTLSSNIMGTVNVLESIRKLNFPCIGILITSDKCYDNVEWLWGYKETDTLGGKDIYSGSKAAAEIIINSYYHSFFKESNVRIASVRAGNVIGGGDWAENRLIPDCLRAWKNKDIVEIRSPKSTRPWQHVLEPLSGYLHLGAILYQQNDLNGESFNFGPSEQNNRSVEILINDLWKYYGSTNSKGYKIIQKTEFHEANLLKLNCDKALTKLDWTATLSYDKLIEFTGEWYRKFYNGVNMRKFTLNQIEEYESYYKGK